MRKVLVSISALAASIAAFAQIPEQGVVKGYMTDGITWSENDYGGTARSMAMGNAVTATGGELGSVIINPAGSAVAQCSQVTLTPGVSVSMVSAAGVRTPDGNTYLSQRTSTNKGRFIMPNIGVNFSFETGRAVGLKRFTFGFISNSSNIFNSSVIGRGLNEEGTSSYAGCMAAASTNGFWNDEISLASDENIICNSPELIGNKDFGITEWPLVDKTASLSSRINQRYNHRIDGIKSDYIINLGFNISDIVFIGANLGIVSLKYSLDESISESAVETDMFPTGFKDLARTYGYRASGAGVYGKFGILVTPFDGLRIGAAIQTPTGMTITENYGYSISNRFLDQSFSGSTSSSGDIRYGVTAPMRFNLGLAYTIGTKAVVSVDYERVNYKYLKYNAKLTEDIQWFEAVNEQIQGIGRYGDDCLAASNILRAGIEFKPIAEFALRAGYNLISDGTRFYDSSHNRLGGISTHSASAGIGYISSGSFFCDLAAKYIMRPDLTLQAYPDYDNRGEIENGTYLEISGPRLGVRRNNLQIVATLGWRF